MEVQLVQEGACRVTVKFKDGSETAIDLTVTRVTGDCCSGLFLDSFETWVAVPYSGCPGSCGHDGGC
jgi:hypothetical protein